MSAYADVRRTFSEVISTKLTGNSSGANDLIALTASRKIRVLALSISVASAVNVKFTSGTGPTDITGLFYLTTGELNINLPFNPFGWFQTAAGEKLGMDLSSGVVTNLQITYVLI